MADYGGMLLEWTNLFKHLGKGLAMAFGDITDKANRVLSNQKFMIE